MEKMTMLTQERLKEVLDYNPETGIFTWKIQMGSRGQVNTVAGVITFGGYRHIHIDLKDYKAHRLACLYMTGEWPKYPEYEVHHKNHTLDDNRWCNLEKVTKFQNQAHKGRAKNNTSWKKGVTWHVRIKMWQARIGVENTRIHLGYFNTVNEAAAAYRAAAVKYHKEYAFIDK